MTDEQSLSLVKDEAELGFSGKDYPISQSVTKKHNKKLILTNIVASITLIVGLVSLVWAALFTPLLGIIWINEDPNIFVPPVRSEHDGLTYFLVLGRDPTGRTNVMIVVKINHDDESAAMLQIPRDLFIGLETHAHRTGRANAVFSGARDGESNINAMKRFVNNYLGLPVDHYILFTLNGLRNTVDAMGGVPMYFERQMMVTNECQHVPYPIGPGWVTLSGFDAESFVRHRRSYAMGDLARMEAQSRFMAAFAREIQNMGAGQAASAARASFGEISTDLTVNNLLSFMNTARELDLDDVFMASVPGQSGTFTPAGLSVARSYVSIHKQCHVDLINEHFLPPDAQVTIDDLRIPELHDTKRPAQTFAPGTMRERS